MVVMVRQNKSSGENDEEIVVLPKKQKTEKKKGSRRRLVAKPTTSVAEVKELSLQATYAKTQNLAYPGADALALLMLYLILDILLLIGFARFKLLFIAVLFVAAYLLNKNQKANLLLAWLSFLSFLFIGGGVAFFFNHHAELADENLNFINGHQMVDFFSVESLLWTLLLLGIVFAVLIYYPKKKEHISLALEWRVAFFNMLLFWGFMYLVFQNAA